MIYSLNQEIRLIREPHLLNRYKTYLPQKSGQVSQVWVSNSVSLSMARYVYFSFQHFSLSLKKPVTKELSSLGESTTVMTAYRSIDSALTKA